MKFKKLIALSIIVLIVFLIYIMTIDRKIYYVSLGDSFAIGINPYGKIDYGYSDYIADYLKKSNILEFYTKSFAKNDYRTIDLIHDIEDNKETIVNGKKKTIKNALIKADIVTISIGSNDIFYKMGINDMKYNLEKKEDIYKYIDEVIEDYNKLFSLLRQYCKEDIIIIGLYNPLSRISVIYSRNLEPGFVYANDKLKKLSKKYNAYYIDIYQIFKENPNYFPNPNDIHPNIEGYKVIANQIIDVIENNIIN